MSRFVHRATVAIGFAVALGYKRRFQNEQVKTVHVEQRARFQYESADHEGNQTLHQEANTSQKDNEDHSDVLEARTRTGDALAPNHFEFDKLFPDIPKDLFALDEERLFFPSVETVIGEAGHYGKQLLVKGIGMMRDGRKREVLLVKKEFHHRWLKLKRHAVENAKIVARLQPPYSMIPKVKSRPTYKYRLHRRILGYREEMEDNGEDYYKVPIYADKEELGWEKSSNGFDEMTAELVDGDASQLVQTPPGGVDMVQLGAVFVRQMLDALISLREKGYSHTDFKLDNVLYKKNAKNVVFLLTDFDLLTRIGKLPHKTPEIKWFQGLDMEDHIKGTIKGDEDLMYLARVYIYRWQYHGWNETVLKTDLDKWDEAIRRQQFRDLKGMTLGAFNRM